ncbi:MAG: glycosyltransferase family A protein [Gammaproteobacteria bacterium]
MGGYKKPTVCLGMPLYNQTEFLKQALESLLGQSYRDFRLVIVDDSSDDQSGEIAKQYASTDNRIHYFKNISRKAIVDNWKLCVHSAGDADYFAWVGDHDIWHTEWLESMVRVLDMHPNVVLVYPQAAHITSAGQRRSKKLSQSFSTDGLGKAQRVRAVCKEARYYGKKVYGLYRVSALRRAGIFRRVLFPDVILLLELSLYGDFKQVDTELWSMRQLADFSIARQKISLFVSKPWYIFLPWPLVNTAVLAWNTAIRPGVGNLRHRLLGFKMAVMYFYRWIGNLGEGSMIGSYHEWRKGKKPWIKKLRNQFRK